MIWQDQILFHKNIEMSRRPTRGQNKVKEGNRQDGITEIDSEKHKATEK